MIHDLADRMLHHHSQGDISDADAATIRELFQQYPDLEASERAEKIVESVRAMGHPTMGSAP